MILLSRFITDTLQLDDQTADDGLQTTTGWLPSVAHLNKPKKKPKKNRRIDRILPAHENCLPISGDICFGIQTNQKYTKRE